MEKMDRRMFLKMVGVGTGAVAIGATVPMAGLLGGKGADAVAFRAVSGLPSGALPSYASYVVEGTVNLRTRSGVLTRAVYAGNPEAMSTIALPRFTQVVRVTDVREMAGITVVKGVVDDASQLRPGENAVVELRLDRSRGVAWTGFLGQNVEMRLQA